MRIWTRSLTLPRGIRRVFALPTTRTRLERDAEEEMRIHIEMWTAELIAEGKTPTEADAEARQRFGDPDEYRRYARNRASRKVLLSDFLNWLVEWSQDARLALRHFRLSPGFTAVAVLTLALGIGANTAIFSAVHRLLIAPLPYPNGDRVVALKTVGKSGFVGALVSMSPAAPGDPPRSVVHAWANRRVPALDMMAGVDQRYLTLLPNDVQDTVSYAYATASLLPMLGAQPAFGRTFLPAEESPGHNRVAMISYRWWQAEYAGASDVLGKTLQYEDSSYTIVGVMPHGFEIPMAPHAVDWISENSPDVWLPEPLRNTTIIFGRLGSGATAATAASELQAIADTPEARGVGKRPARFGPPDSLIVHVMRAQDFIAPREVRTIQVLFVAVAALLLIACANVSNLLLARAWSRRRELAIRMGLGAGRARLVRLVLTESVLLALTAGAIGLVLAWQSLRIIVALRPIGLDQLADVHVDTPVLLWTLGVSVVAGIAFGGAAALFVGSQGAAELLRGESHTASGNAGTRRVRRGLIVAQIALSLALLVGTGLLVRSLVALQQTPIGFAPRNLVSVDVLFGPQIRRANLGDVTRQQILERLRAVPGVLDASVGMIPTAGFRAGGSVLEAASGADVRSTGVTAFQQTWITPEYFRTSGIRLRSGRLPQPGLDDAVPKLSLGALSDEIVISQSLAQRIAPDGNALGVRIRAAHPQSQDVGVIDPLAAPAAVPSRSAAPATSAASSDTWATVVGIVDDVRLPGPRGDLETYEIYEMPVARMPDPTFVLRFADVPPHVESVLRQAIQTVNPTIIVRRARLASDYVREALAPTRFTLALLGAFALVALALSTVGLYASIAYAVSQRTREIGIRVALGATPASVTTLVAGDGIRLAAVGLAIGVAVSLASTRALASLLYSVGASDPLTFAAIAAIVGLVATAAAYVPARRAARLDPVDALRAD